MLVFDIETCPRPQKELRQLCPSLDESQFIVGEFDPDAVKTGNMKDQAKIDAKIAAAKKEHEKKAASAAEDLATAKCEHFSNFQQQACINAAYGRVLAIGLFDPAPDKFVCWSAENTDAEICLLGKFWETATVKFDAGQKLIGQNIFDFDLPFLLRRSWILGVKVPPHIVTGLESKWPKWNERFVDVGKYWLAGQYPGSTKWNFNVLAAAFNTGGKPDGPVDGGNFWEQWQTNRRQAIDYLESDVRQPALWAERMGIKD